jgi:hypothetical protein
MTKKQKIDMYAKIERHGRDLLALFPNAKITDPVKLCKALRRLEVQAHKAAENWCNGIDCGPDGNKQYNAGLLLMAKASDILGMSAAPACGLVFRFNGDARGYALKLTNGGDYEDKPVQVEIYKDWGGYGIIAPDFSPIEKQ